jgi:hypothetical protein
MIIIPAKVLEEARARHTGCLIIHWPEFKGEHDRRFEVFTSYQSPIIAKLGKVCYGQDYGRETFATGYGEEANAEVIV